MELNYQNKLLKLKTIKTFLKIFLFIFIFDYVFFPAPLVASTKIEFDDIVFISSEKTKDVFLNVFPQSADLKSIRTSYHTLTAYNSEVAQCDDSPCITANGFNVCEHGIEDTIAANFLRFGTKVKIPELFGDRVFVVRDRMNKRYTSRVDIWMVDKNDAKRFGIKYAKIEVLE